MEIHNAPSWDNAKAFAQSLGEGWIFRGMADADWPLRTSLERLETTDRPGLERQLLTEFQRRALTHLEPNFVPAEDSVFRWWALMQHYNAPTRLLDWTHSFYIACFFAFEPQIENPATRAVWAIRTSWLQSALAEQFVLTQEREGKHRRFDGTVEARAREQRRALAGIVNNAEGVVTNLFRDNPYLGVLPVEPWLYDARQAAQQSIFLCPADSTRTFADNLDACRAPQSGADLVKVELDGTFRRETLRDLQRMNVSAATLFPGLDGLGRSLQTRYV